MINKVITNFLRFVLLVLLQVLIIKNIELGRFINPFIYVLSIIILPFETPKWLTLIVALVVGLTIDMFYDTMGMHACATVFMAYLRPSILNLFSPREGYAFGTEPTIKQLGVPWFLSYSSILIFFHHFVLFFLEVFRFSEFFSTFLRIIFSAVFSILLIVIIQYFFTSKNEQE